MTILRWFISQTVRNGCAARKHYRRLLDAQRDLLSPEAIAAIRLKLDELTAAINEGHTGRINIKAEELQFAAEKNLKPYPHAAWRENVEVLLVALAVAMSIRTFFLQPFKIPTGSMQPTLFGVTSTPDFGAAFAKAQRGMVEQAQVEFQKQFDAQKKMVIPTGWERIKASLRGTSYVHFVAPADGKIEEIKPPWPSLIFSIFQKIKFAGEWHTIWFPPDYGESSLRFRAGLFEERVYHKGDDVIKLQASAGDHLFVDRLSYNFRKPDRGDIIVFETAGIPEEMRDRYHISPDEFYVKRLVGLPGEKIQIGDDRHLRINGVRLDASTPHFENLYGFDPGTPPQDSHFSGHVNGTVSEKYNLDLGIPPLFPDQEKTYEVPANSFMPMGDNTCNSLDSRFFGAIPIKHALGKSFFVYWPLTDRFGWGNQ